MEREIKLYNSDTLEYSGSIIVHKESWKFKDVENEHMISVTKGFPIKGLLANLIYFDLVYDIVATEAEVSKEI